MYKEYVIVTESQSVVYGQLSQGKLNTLGLSYYTTECKIILEKCYRIFKSM